MGEINIKEGDKVDIYWEYVGYERNLEVIYIPVATGDCWHLLRPDGTIVYVGIFSKMVKCDRKLEPPF